MTIDASARPLSPLRPPLASLSSPISFNANTLAACSLPSSYSLTSLTVSALRFAHTLYLDTLALCARSGGEGKRLKEEGEEGGKGGGGEEKGPETEHGIAKG